MVINIIIQTRVILVFPNLKTEYLPETTQIALRKTLSIMKVFTFKHKILTGHQDLK